MLLFKHKVLQINIILPIALFSANKLMDVTIKITKNNYLLYFKL
jgi:hypothetical protein